MRGRLLRWPLAPVARRRQGMRVHPRVVAGDKPCLPAAACVSWWVGGDTGGPCHMPVGVTVPLPYPDERPRVGKGLGAGG